MILNDKIYRLELIIFKTNLGLSFCVFLHDQLIHLTVQPVSLKAFSSSVMAE